MQIKFVCNDRPNGVFMRPPHAVGLRSRPAPSLPPNPRDLPLFRPPRVVAMAQSLRTSLWALDGCFRLSARRLLRRKIFPKVRRNPAKELGDQATHVDELRGGRRPTHGEED